MVVKAFLFCGLPGLNKKECLKRIRKFAIDRFDAEEKLALSSKEKTLGYEKQIIPIYEIPHFHEEYSSLRHDALRKEIIDSFNKILATLQEEIYNIKHLKYVFLHTHLSFWLDGSFYSWLSTVKSQPLFSEKIEIVRIIVLIDNVFYHCYNTRLYHIPIYEMSIWRDVELTLADTLQPRVFNSQASGQRVDLLAINHPLRTAYNLLFKPNEHRVYLGYPISEPRRWQRDAARQEKAEEFFTQNKEFRKHMSGEFIAFDPSSIDEVLPRFTNGRLDRKTAPKNTLIRASELWPTSCKDEETIRGKPHKTVPILTKELADFVRKKRISSEGHEDNRATIKSLAHRNIRARDFRLIEQSEGVIFFRPTLRSEWSRGVSEEFNFALQTIKPTCVIRDKKDGPIFQSEASTLATDNRNRVEIIEKDLTDTTNRSSAFTEAANYMKEKLDKIKTTHV